MEFLKEIYDGWVSRLRSRIVGSTFVAFLLINWESIYFLFFSSQPAASRLAFFNLNVHFTNGVLVPILAGVVYVIAIPWINFASSYVTQRPLRLYHEMSAQETFQRNKRGIVHEIDLETLRSELQERREKNKIDEAERLKRAREVGGEKLESEIEADRAAGKISEDDDPDLYQLLRTLTRTDMAIIDALRLNPDDMGWASLVDMNSIKEAALKDNAAPNNPKYPTDNWIKDSIQKLRTNGVITMRDSGRLGLSGLGRVISVRMNGG